MRALAIGVTLTALAIAAPLRATSWDCARPIEWVHLDVDAPHVARFGAPPVVVTRADGTFDVDADLVSLDALASAVGAAARIDVDIDPAIANVPVTMTASAVPLSEVVRLLDRFDEPRESGGMPTPIVTSLVDDHLIVARGRHCAPPRSARLLPVADAALRSQLVDALSLYPRVTAVPYGGGVSVYATRDDLDVVTRLADDVAHDPIVAATAAAKCSRPPAPHAERNVAAGGAGDDGDDGDDGGAVIKALTPVAPPTANGDRAAFVRIFEAMRFDVDVKRARAGAAARALSRALGWPIAVQPNAADIRISARATSASFDDVTQSFARAGLRLITEAQGSDRRLWLVAANVESNAVRVRAERLGERDDALARLAAACDASGPNEGAALVGRSLVLRRRVR